MDSDPVCFQTLISVLLRLNPMPGGDIWKWQTISGIDVYFSRQILYLGKYAMRRGGTRGERIVDKTTYLHATTVYLGLDLTAPETNSCEKSSQLFERI